MRIPRRFYHYYLPPLLFMALIFGGSAQSQPPEWLPGWLWSFNLDKLIHAAEYVVLCFLWIRAFTCGAIRTATTKQLVWAFAISTAYGFTDEIHQMFVPNRHKDVFDLLADAIGAATAAGAVRFWQHRAARLPESTLPEDGAA